MTSLPLPAAPPPGRRPLTVAVTGLNATDNPGPGVAVMRALLESPDYEVRLVGLSYDALEPGLYLPGLAARSYQLPYPSLGTAALLERLAYVHERERLDVIIPNFDSELFNFSKVAAELRGWGIHTFLPTTEQLASCDKPHLAGFGPTAGLRVPATRLLQHPDELLTAAEALGWPLVLKGRLYDASIVPALEPARRAWQQFSAKWGLPVLAQELVSGTEINVAGLGDGQGGLVSGVAMRKLFITDKGKAWAGITLEDDSLLELGRRFAAATRWRGGFELELMRPAEGPAYLLEVNPRFPAWIYLTAAAGQNQPALLLRLALGEPVPAQTGYVAGKLFVRAAWDLITDHTAFQQMAALGEGF